MRECPACERCYADEVQNCPHDNERLNFGFAGEPLLKGRYLIEQRIGIGGMGKVYRARHLFLKTEHAIKVILPHNLGDDPELVKRFRQEAIATAAIRHPNIVAVTDFDVINDEVPFLVMEYVKGRSLDNLITEEGALPLPKVLELMEAICLGVEAAHGMGVIHRDLKPLNILLQEGVPVRFGLKVLDFGLAKLRRDDMVGSLILARTTGVVGSPYYMAPEQWSEEEADIRTDIYALGVILYQMLSGVVPFKGPSIMSVMKQHLFNAPPALPASTRPLPPELQEVVQRALAKDREHRPATVTEFWREVSAAAHPELARTQYVPPAKQAPPDLAPPIVLKTEPAFLAPPPVRQENAPTVVENIAELLVEPEDSVQRWENPTVPLVLPANVPMPVVPPPPVSFVPPPAAKPVPPDLDETLVRATNSLLPGKGGQSTLNDMPDVSAPNMPVRLTLPIGEKPPVVRVPEAPVIVRLDDSAPPPVPAPSRLGLWVGLGAMALLVIGGLGWGLKSWFGAGRETDKTPVKISSPMGNNGRTLVLDYYVQTKEGAKVPENQPLKVGQSIKLHFLSKDRGYLYILTQLPDKSLQMFLSRNPAEVTKLSSNQLEAGADFAFPGGDQFLTLNAAEGLREVTYVYTIILSPQPLSNYAFLDASDIRSLTAQETSQFQDLQKQAIAQGDIVNVETSATNKWLRSVSLSAQLGAIAKDSRRLAIFEISLRAQ